MLKLFGLENLKLMVDMEGENNPTLKLTGGYHTKHLLGHIWTLTERQAKRLLSFRIAGRYLRSFYHSVQC